MDPENAVGSPDNICRGGHRVLLNSKHRIDRRGEEANMIKFTV